MFNSIQIKHGILLKKLKDKNESILKNHNENQCNISEEHFTKLAKEQPTKKVNVPIKEYSNKFLRQSNLFNIQKQNQKVPQQHSRLNNIVKKHKALQKKFNNVISKKMYICKTEPNETEYKCFMTSNNFYKVQDNNIRIKTQMMLHKQAKIKTQFEKEDKYEGQNISQLNDFEVKQNKFQQQQKIKVKFDNLISLNSKKDQKISSSRALEMFSKVLSKDKGDLLQKIKLSNQKKMIKDKILESTKNLQAKQMILMQKDKKFSFIQKGEKRPLTISKNRKKTHYVFKNMFAQDENYQIKGWETQNE